MERQSKSSAMDRIISILDECSFVETGSYIEARSTDFNIAEKKAANDGVITGYGTIDSRLVYVYAQDPATMGGSVGEMHAEKIERIYDMAMKVGAPVVALLDSTGLRLMEGYDALNATGRIIRKMSMASGIIPEIAMIYGNCGGAMSILSSISDFVFMEKENGRLFVSAPLAVKGNKTDDIAKANSKAAAGLVDFVGTNEEMACELRKLITFIPSNNEHNDSFEECNDDLNRAIVDFKKMDALTLMKNISDNGIIFETRKGYTDNVITGLLRLNGITSGFIANNKDMLSAEGLKKATSLIKFCNAFTLPVLTYTDVKGFVNSKETEEELSKAAAGLTYAYANADVPMVNIIKNACGTAGLTFASKSLGVDIVLALNGADISIMDGKEAAKIIFSNEYEEADDKVSFINEKSKEYNEKYNSAIAAARRAYVDDIIAPEAIRQRAIAAMEMLFGKKILLSDKKHGTV